MKTRFFAEDATADPVDDEYRRHRVRLFVQFMLMVDLVAYASDYVSPLLVHGLIIPDYPLLTRGLRLSATAVVALAWVWIRFARPGRRALFGIEAGVTLWLTVVYVNVATAHMTGDDAPYGPIFAMFGLMLLLSMRAALVPSPVFLTVGVGVASMACLAILAQDAIEALAPNVLDGLVFIGGAYVIATGLTSHVIYGLRRDVRQALKLGQYTLGEKLGEGGMGAVFRARHALLRREAAIKLVRPELIDANKGKTQAMQRFEREARVTAGLRSPHTIELYDFGATAEGSIYYVMELLDGLNLDVAVRKFGPMPSRRAIHVLQQMCESLEEAHEAGLVHRDIKPANVFLCRYGLSHDFVKVLDFGLVAPASGIPGQEKLSMDHLAAGTPAYIAPEALTRPDLVDRRADIYGVGCVAYWLLTGRAPFERPTPMATLAAHLSEEPLPMSKVAGVDVPASVDALIVECLAKDPARRPSSSAEFSDRLTATLDGRPWNQTEAKEWWEAHGPALETGEDTVAGRTSVTVLRV